MEKFCGRLRKSPNSAPGAPPPGAGGPGIWEGGGGPLPGPLTPWTAGCAVIVPHLPAPTAPLAVPPLPQDWNSVFSHRKGRDGAGGGGLSCQEQPLAWQPAPVLPVPLQDSHTWQCGDCASYPDGRFPPGPVFLGIILGNRSARKHFQHQNPRIIPRVGRPDPRNRTPVNFRTSENSLDLRNSLVCAPVPPGSREGPRGEPGEGTGGGREGRAAAAVASSASRCPRTP